jgi:hypothetical protein
VSWQVGGDPNKARHTSSSSWCIHMRGALIPMRDSPSLPLPLPLHSSLTPLLPYSTSPHFTPQPKPTTLLPLHSFPTSLPHFPNYLVCHSSSPMCPHLGNFTRKTIKQAQPSSFESVGAWATCCYCNILSYLEFKRLWRSNW